MANKKGNPPTRGKNVRTYKNPKTGEAFTFHKKNKTARGIAKSQGSTKRTRAGLHKVAKSRWW